MRAKLLLRLVLVVLVIFGAVISWYNEFYISFGITCLVLVLLIAELFFYLRKFEHRVEAVLLGVEKGELGFDMLKFVSKKNKQALKSVIEKYKERRTDIETDRYMVNELLMYQGVGVIIYAPDGEEVLFNQSAAELLGVPQGVKFDLLRKRIPEIAAFYDGGEVKCRCILEEAKMSGVLGTVVIEGTKIYGKNGQYLALNIQALGDTLSKKESEGWLSLIKVLSHEVMNGITPVISLSETLKENLSGQGLDPSVLTAMDAIHSQALALRKFTDNYRKFTQVSRTEKEWISPVELVEEVLVTFKSRLADKGIQLITRMDFQGKVFLDPLQLRQVLVNLIQNAIAALDGEQNPKLSVTLAKDDQIMLLEVYDNGKGIPQEELGKIFIPFYTTVEDGTGIGLSVCRQIVWNHGGKISVDSNEGAHTKFTLEFPFS